LTYFLAEALTGNLFSFGAATTRAATTRAATTSPTTTAATTAVVEEAFYMGGAVEI